MEAWITRRTETMKRTTAPPYELEESAYVYLV